MALLPLRSRPFQTFISHAHADKSVVDRVHAWLSQTARVKVWYDATDLPPGAMIATHLSEAISQCRTLIIVLSKASVTSGWVQEEYEAAVGQRTSHHNFRIIPLRIEECEVPGFLRTTKWIDLSHGDPGLEVYDELLAGLYYEDTNLDAGSLRDVYISRSWRESEARPADHVCRQLIKAGFRLIGDSPDQQYFGERRVESIISSCGGLAAVLPDRGGGATSKYMIGEIELALANHIPCLVLAESTVSLPDHLRDLSIPFEPAQAVAGGPFDAALWDGIETLRDEWRPPDRPHYVFFSTSFDDERQQSNQVVKRAIERITAIPCIVGDNIRQESVQQEILRLIRNATVMVADISDDKLNTCIEAGMALGAGTRVHLICREPRRRPPFMFRDRQVEYYGDGASLLGVVHHLVYPYRRRVLNWELAD